MRFLEIPGEKKRDENLITLINLGSCSINTVHNSFKNEEVTFVWKVKKPMSSLHRISEDLPRPLLITRILQNQIIKSSACKPKMVPKRASC